MSDHTENQQVNKLRILVYGNNSPYVDSFFEKAESFECLTTSSRVRDFENHLRYFKPHAFLVALKGISIELLPRFAPLKEYLVRYRVPFYAYGTRDEVTLFEGVAGYKPDTVISFPQTMSNVVAAIADSIGASIGSGGIGEAVPRRYHILVIDDDVLMLRAIRRILEDKFDVATATSGRQAFKYFADNTTDLILLDYNMPVEMGDAVFKNLRGWRKTEEIPIIFLTGINDVNEIKKLLVLKPQGYIMKPVEPEVLFEKIEAVLRG